MSKIGFCFTGEGARGSVQAGIALGLHNQGIDADLTIGISSGSICAASYAYLGPKGLADMWSNISNMFDVFGINYNFLWKSGIFNQKPMEKIVYESLKNDPVCECIVSRMNIENGFMDYVSNKNVSTEDFAEAVLGSVAITALVEDRNGWVDAGSRQLAPLEQCIEFGCDKIYVIMGRQFKIDEWSKPKGFLPAVKMAYRAFDISLQEIMVRDITNCLRKEGDFGYKGIDIHLVEPNKTFFESICFNKCKMGVELGSDQFRIYDKKGIRKLL